MESITESNTAKSVTYLNVTVGIALVTFRARIGLSGCFNCALGLLPFW